MACSHYTRPLTEEDRHHVYAPQHNNCVLCLVNTQGSLTQEEVATYTGLSKMRVSQIEAEALRKLKRSKKHFVDFV